MKKKKKKKKTTHNCCKEEHHGGMKLYVYRQQRFCRSDAALANCLKAKVCTYMTGALKLKKNSHIRHTQPNRTLINAHLTQ